MATISSYQAGTFVGISHLFFVDGGFADSFGVTGKTIKELPVAEDGGFTYDGGSPNVEHYKVHGLSGDWTSRMTPGDTEINLFIPTVDADVLAACGFVTTSQNSGPVVADADAGDYKFTATSGYTFSVTQKAFSVGVAVINDEGNKMFAIKRVKLLASITFDSADTAKPIGVTLSGSSAASSAADAMGIFEGSIAVVTT